MIRFSIRALKGANDLFTVTQLGGNEEYDMDATEPVLPPLNDEIYHVLAARSIPQMPIGQVTKEQKDLFIAELRNKPLTEFTGYKVRRVQ